MKDTPMSQILSGQVDIELDGETVTLQPTLSAAVHISKHFGGIQAAYEKVNAFDLEAIAAVVRAGLGHKPTDEAKVSLESVYAAGVVNLHALVRAFVLIVANGGKPMIAQTAETAAGNEASA